MSFTQDELQALEAIWDQKTTGLLSELVRLFEQKTQILQNDIKRNLEESIERSFAAQLLAFERLINQRFPVSNIPVPVVNTDQPQANFEAIEVQTEIPWEDLLDLLKKALYERFIPFNTSLQAQLRDMEREVLSQIQLLRDDLRKQRAKASFSGTSGRQELIESGQEPDKGKPYPAPTEAEMQDMLTSIGQLERIVESMQVAMTANSTLISNRLYHHQSLPIERAHPSHTTSPAEHEHSIEQE
jgi:hypothetical protein